MDIKQEINQALEKLMFENRERDFHHHSIHEDRLQYEYMRDGDPRAIAEGKRMFEGPTNGMLSDDPVQSYQLIFVAATTLCCRYCADGGLPTEITFGMADLYIRRAMKCTTVQEVFDLHDVMFRDYTERMRLLHQRNTYSRPINECIDYIDQHLQQPLNVAILAEKLRLSGAYLSTVFKRETGTGLSDYIRMKRIDVAKALLEHTGFSCLEIAMYLCFSSDSHFSQIFQKYTGLKPSEYRRLHSTQYWKDKQE